MRFDEAVKKINENTCLYARYRDGALNVSTAPFSEANMAQPMARVPKGAKDWNHIYFSLIDPWIGRTASNKDFAYMFKTIEKLLSTPINKRFKEKKYHLRWFVDDNDGQQLYLALMNHLCLNLSGGSGDLHTSYTDRSWLAIDDPDCEAATFTSLELEELKRNHPEMAGAIDAMTVEADDDE